MMVEDNLGLLTEPSFFDQIRDDSNETYYAFGLTVIRDEAGHGYLTKIKNKCCRKKDWLFERIL